MSVQKWYASTNQQAGIWVGYISTNQQATKSTNLDVIGWVSEPVNVNVTAGQVELQVETVLTVNSPQFLKNNDKPMYI